MLSKTYTNCRGIIFFAGVDLGGIPLSRAPQIFRRNTSNPVGLPTFAVIWGPEFRASIIRLTCPHVFKQIKNRITLMTMFRIKVDRGPPNEVMIMAGMAVFNVAGYLMEERRRWPVITASPRGQCSK